MPKQNEPIFAQSEPIYAQSEPFYAQNEPIFFAQSEPQKIMPKVSSNLCPK